MFISIFLTLKVILILISLQVSKTFRPDFLLVRQHVRDAHHDYRPLLLGLRYGGVPSINSIHSLYNFQDKPWVVSTLKLQ